MSMLFVSPIEDNSQLLNELDQITRDWTYKAARGECSWICSDCSCSFSEGMPNECPHGHERCTQIIQRDKNQAINQC